LSRPMPPRRVGVCAVNEGAGERMGVEKHQRERHCSGIYGDGQHHGLAVGPCAQPSNSGTDSGRPLGETQGYRGRGIGSLCSPARRLCARARSRRGWGLAGTMRSNVSLTIKPKDACRWDLVSLGESDAPLRPRGLSHLGPPGTSEVSEGGASTTFARGLKKMFRT